MNWIQFGRLIRAIYRRDGKLPDLQWIQDLGLLAVKLGQIHALRIDFLDEEICAHLAKLYRQNSAVPAEDFHALLRASGIDGFESHFSSIDEQPLATASVGQVHRGRLKTGEAVVIKAVKANVRENFRDDVASVRRLFRFITLFYPRLRRVGNPVGILDDIEEYTSSELDLRNEIAGASALAEIRDANASRFDFSRLRFARSWDSISNENVLVSEFVAGDSVDELLERREFRYEQMLDLFRIHGFFMFRAGRFHGDLHPGNVLVSDGDFCFIDTGYVADVSERLRNGLFDFFAALSEYDYPLCADALNAMSVAPLDGGSMDRFRRQFESLYSDFRGATVSEVSLTRQMMQTIRLGVTAGMEFEQGMFGIIRSLMYMDGMVLRCNPDAMLMEDLRPMIDQFDSAAAA